jgi:Acetyltransferase (GNAT) family
MEAYGFPSRRSELELYLAAQPDGWVVIGHGDEIVAVGGALAYGPFCWIGLVATDPARRREGLATKLSAHLVDWAHARGCTTIALDASEAGRPSTSGWAFESLERQWSSHRQRSPTRRPASRSLGLTTSSSCSRSTGGSSAATEPGCCVLSREENARCYVATNGNEPAGYLFARKRLLGPGCASTDDVAHELVSAALADRAATDDTGERRLLLPIESRYLDALGRLGLSVQRRLAHMRLGDPRLPGQRDELLAQTSYAAG